MRVLLLGPYRPSLINFLSSEDEVITSQDYLTENSKCLQNTDFIISYGYRHVIKNDVLNKFTRRAINLHISLLPWNRGADPNLWSFLEDTPKGVTIHYIDHVMDTGNIIAQQEVFHLPDDTLRTSYERLSRAIENLFKEVWPYIRKGQAKSRPQPPGGSYHSVKDRAKYEYLLSNGWDTPISNIIGKALKNKRGDLFGRAYKSCK